MNKSVLLLPSLALATCTLHAQILWEGANNSGSKTSTDVEDAANWTPNQVPGIGDTAQFIYRGGANNPATINIDTSDTLFDPSGLYFESNASPDGFQQTSDLIIDKDLNLTDGLVIVGSGSSGSASRDNERLRIGTNQLGTVWTINGGIDISTGGAGWNFFRLGTGDATADSGTVLNLTGNMTFTTPNRDGSIITNSVNAENDTNTMAPQMRMTTPGAVITLESAGQNTNGTIGLGYTNLDVRSDQTWNADPLSFVRMHGSVGSGTGPGGKFVVESIDGARLDNLGGLNIRIDGNQGSSASDATAMRMQGGTYGSLWMNSSGTSGRTQRINQVDDVSYQAQTVEFDGLGNPFQSGYGLTLQNGAGNADTQIYDTKGFDLDVTNGVKLTDTAGGGTVTDRPLLIVAEDSTVTIGGDVLYDAPNRRPIEAFSGNTAQNQIGIDGGTNGADITIGGSFETRVLSYASRDNWINSTVTFTGDANTIEVGDDSTTTGLVSGTYGFGTLNIGEALDAANIGLDNQWLNNNPATTGDAAIDKEGEKLIAGALNIAANSTLDTNGLDVEVGDLDIDFTGSLDLNTGLVLSDGSIVESFIGLGDQTADWAIFSAQVTDSSNPLYEFAPILDGGDTKWQASLVPEPSTYALIFAAVAGVVAYRRRRR